MCVSARASGIVFLTVEFSPGTPSPVVARPVFTPADIGPEPFMDVVSQELENEVKDRDDGSSFQYLIEPFFCRLAKYNKGDQEGGCGTHDAPADGFNKTPGRGVLDGSGVSFGGNTAGGQFHLREACVISRLGFLILL